MYAVFISPRASYFVTEISVDGPELRTIRKVMGGGRSPLIGSWWWEFREQYIFFVNISLV